MRLGALFLLAGCDRLLQFGPIHVYADGGADTAADAPTATRVQEATTSSNKDSVVTVTLPNLPTSQHVLVLVGGAELGVMAPVGGGVASGGWQLAASSFRSPGVNIWFGVTDGSSNAVMLQTTGVDSTMWADLTEWSGLVVPNPFDAMDASGLNSAGSASLGVPTRSSPDLLVLAIVCYGSITLTNPGSWTDLQPVSTSATTQDGWFRITSGTGTQTGQVDCGGAGWDAALAALRIGP